MASLSINHLKVVGMSACIPTQIEENKDLSIFKDIAEAEKTITLTGIERRRMVTPGTTASDLTVKAVEKNNKRFKMGKRND